MRIIAGSMRGRSLVAPKGTDTRPTSDRVREALFSRLESLQAVCGASVLDAFAGTGALGLEALSRGAARVTFVEQSRLAVEALRQNIAGLGVASVSTVTVGDVRVLGARGLLTGGPYSLLFVDPPYRIDESIVAGLLTACAENGLLSDRAHVVWEHAAERDTMWPEGFTSLGERRYGSTAVDVAVFAAGGEDA